MLLPIEQIVVDGAWAGPPPEEHVDYLLMRVMRWSWRDLQATPMYVRHFVLHELECEAQRQRRDEERRRRA